MSAFFPALCTHHHPKIRYCLSKKLPLCPILAIHPSQCPNTLPSIPMPSGILYVSTRYQDPLDSTTLHSTQPSRHIARGIPFFFFFFRYSFFFLLGCLPNMPTPPQIPGDQFPFQFFSLDPAILGGSPRECSWNKHRRWSGKTCRVLTTPCTPSFPFTGGGGARPHPGVISLPL